jgi:hypothetical protein
MAKNHPELLAAFKEPAMPAGAAAEPVAGEAKPGGEAPAAQRVEAAPK